MFAKTFVYIGFVYEIVAVTRRQLHVLVWIKVEEFLFDEVRIVGTDETDVVAPGVVLFREC